MNPPRPHRQRTFFWQGILILLPVAVLAAVGLYSLSQDRLVVQQEATERARAIGDELLATIWQKLITLDNEPDRQLLSSDAYSFSVYQTMPTPTPGKPDTLRISFETISFSVDSFGLNSPAPYNPNPAPRPLYAGELTPEQLDLWQAFRLAEASNPARVIPICREFIKLNPPPRFSAIASYALGLALARAGDPQGAREAFDFILKNHASVSGESGLPLVPMVMVKRFELETNHLSGSYDEICQRLLARPSPLTRQLIESVESIAVAHRQNHITRYWQSLWDRNELARELFDAAQAKYPAPPVPPLPIRWNERKIARLNENGSVVTRSTNFNEALPSIMQLHLPGKSPAQNSIYGEIDWFVVRGESTREGQRYICRPKNNVARYVMDIINGKSLHTVHVPDYLGISVDVAGEPLISDSNSPVWFEFGGGKGGGYHKQELDPAIFHAPVLATAHSPQAGDNQVAIKVHLTNARAMYANQEARTLRFSLLIGTATLAAFIGFVSARRAFHRQQHLNEMKDNFVSGVSHELRAPLASVRLMAENLEQGRVAEVPKQNEYYRFIVQECRRLSSLIENVLDFSRIEQGRKQYEFESTDVTALVRQTIKLMEPAAAEAHVTLNFTENEVALSALPSPALIDGQAVQQALINLIDNAIKHSPKDSTVKVVLELAGPRLRFTVADQGDGIPPEEHKRIFERFYRCGSELRRETQGVGIGLSIVKHIVEAHGGVINVESDVGQGSRFVMELPLQPGKERR